MNKSVLIGVIVVLLAIGGIGFVLTRPKAKPATSATPTTASSQTDTMKDANMAQNSQTTQNGSGSTQETPQVEMKDLSFSPTTIKIKAGTKVTWTNQDSVKHDVAPDKASEDFKGSELLAKGESYSFTFKKIGTYTYHCTPHPFMKGTIEVTE